MMLCGMHESCITPRIGMEIPGDFLPDRGMAIDDDLYVKAAWFEDDGNSALILVLDTVQIPEAISIKLKSEVAEACWIEPASILLAATHDHSGGPLSSMRPDAADVDYLRTVASGCVNAASMAKKRRQPVKIGYARGLEERVSFNRRYWFRDGTVHTWPDFDNPDRLGVEGGVDPDVAVIRIDDLDGNPVGVISNFACHVTAHIGISFSADYPGQISKIIKKQLGDSVVSLFMTGACGNLTQVDWEERIFSRAQIFGNSHHITMGNILGCDILRIREFAFPKETSGVRIRTDRLQLGRRFPSEKEYRNALAYLEANPEGTSATRSARVEEYYAISLRELHEEEHVLPADVQVLRVGNMAVAAFPAELFFEYSVELKKIASTDNLLVCTLANGNIGYIPTLEAFQHGGYETRLGFTSCAEFAAGDKMILQAAKMLHEMGSAK
jgi:neutral ceramidase